MYAGSGSGVFKSSDGGASWISAGLTQNAVSVLVIDPGDPDTVYAIADGAVFKSTDGGTDWSPSNNGLPDPRQAFFSDLIISPGDASTIYLAAGAHLFKSIDGAQTWSSISYLPGDKLLIPRGSPNIIYTAGPIDDYGDASVYTSTDAGATWAAADGELPFDRTDVLALDPKSPRTIYTGSHWNNPAGVSKSTDAGYSWSALGKVFGSSTVSVVLVDPRNPNTIYAGTLGSGVFRTTDGGASWSEFNGGLKDLNINALVTDSSGTHLYAATQAGVFDYTAGTGPAPKITSAVASGKKLFLFGEDFGDNAVVLLNGEDQTTRNDSANPQTVLIAPRAGMRIMPGDKVQVRNPDGSLSEAFTFAGS